MSQSLILFVSLLVSHAVSITPPPTATGSRLKDAGSNTESPVPTFSPSPTSNIVSKSLSPQPTVTASETPSLAASLAPTVTNAISEGGPTFAPITVDITLLISPYEPTDLCAPTQLHLSPGTPAHSSMWVSWTTSGDCSSVVEHVKKKDRQHGYQGEDQSEEGQGGRGEGNNNNNNNNGDWVTTKGPAAVRYQVHDDDGGLSSLTNYMYALAYQSDFLHHVLLSGLSPGSEYAYRVGGKQLVVHTSHEKDKDTEKEEIANVTATGEGTSQFGEETTTETEEDNGAAAAVFSSSFVFSSEHTFRTLHSPGGETTNIANNKHNQQITAMRIAVVGDVGDTKYSNATMTEARQSGDLDSSILGASVDPEFVVVVGDLSYANGDGYKWDEWQEMMQPVLSSLPLLALPGNHEIEMDAVSHDSFVHFRNRFKMPEVAPEQTAPGFVIDQDRYAFNFTYDFGSSYYSFDVGLLHCVMLNVYAKTNHDSLQFEWLSQDLSQVDRMKTPWVLVFTHSPWYDTNLAHQHEEATLTMKEAMEPLLHQHRVAAVFAGHVHAYERSYPVWQDERNDESGTVYITIGDGGNSEGHADSWMGTDDDKIEDDDEDDGDGEDGKVRGEDDNDDEDDGENENDGGQVRHPPPPPPPSWSAFRNGEHYGRGDMVVVNHTHLRWEWWPIGKAEAQDTVWITNPVYYNSTLSPSTTTSGSEEQDEAMMKEAEEESGEDWIFVAVLLAVVVAAFGAFFFLKVWNKPHWKEMGVGGSSAGGNSNGDKTLFSAKKKKMVTRGGNKHGYNEHNYGHDGGYEQVATSDNNLFTGDNNRTLNNGNVSSSEEQNASSTSSPLSSTASAWSALRQDARQRLGLESFASKDEDDDDDDEDEGVTSRVFKNIGDGDDGDSGENNGDGDGEDIEKFYFAPPARKVLFDGKTVPPPSSSSSSPLEKPVKNGLSPSTPRHPPSAEKWSALRLQAADNKRLLSPAATAAAGEEGDDGHNNNDASSSSSFLNSSPSSAHRAHSGQIGRTGKDSPSDIL